MQPGLLLSNTQALGNLAGRVDVCARKAQSWRIQISTGTLRAKEMNLFRQQRAWFWIAAIAVVAAMVLLLVPHADSGHGADWLAVLPVLFVGLISPLAWLMPLAYLRLGYAPDAPLPPPAFQRPPPFRRS